MTRTQLKMPIAIAPIEHQYSIGDRVIATDPALLQWLDAHYLDPSSGVILEIFEETAMISFARETGKSQTYAIPLKNISPLEQVATSEVQEVETRKFQIGDRVTSNDDELGTITDQCGLGFWFVKYDNGEEYHCHEEILEHVLGDTLHDKLAQLEAQRDRLKAEGNIAPVGVWIEYGKVSGRKFRQAYYRSQHPQFRSKRDIETLVKRQYIGEEGSKEVVAAGQAIARRNELAAIAKEIKLLEGKICEQD